nr:MAG TPA: hypothetical protein [Crassvirales sp.]
MTVITFMSIFCYRTFSITRRNSCVYTFLL